MIGFNVKFKDESSRVTRKAKRANFENLFQAGAAVRITARRSIRKRKSPSRPGSAPSTQTGRLKKSIGFGVIRSDETVLIGPSAALVSNVGRAHEFGGRFRSEEFDQRPFMKPALEKNISKLPRFWRGSIR